MSRPTAAKKAGQVNTRGQRTTTADTRPDRAMNDRPVTQDRALSDDERVEMFRQSFHQSALPDLPKIPGYHTCWLTTTNPRDTIYHRVRLGYELLKTSDIPGWEYLSVVTGEYAGCIAVNEMLAAKLPMHLYEAYMRVAHHDEPLAQEQLLRSQIEKLQEQAERVGGKIQVGEGDAELGEDERTATFHD